MLQARLLNLFEQRLHALGVPVSVELWNGKSMRLGDSSRIKLMLALHNARALATLVRPTLGSLARGYVEQDFDVEGDTREVIELGDKLCDTAVSVRRGRVLRKWFKHTPVFDRQAIGYHYDISDEFFGLWLDARRVYSCAYFRSAQDNLDRAQEQKLDHICRKLNLQSGERFLDIGCGWGALVMWAAQHYRVKAVGITLSRNQFEYARRRSAELGLADSCEIKLLDYRDVPESESFDKIASVGMFEHVGTANLPVYFAKIFRLLKPGGLVMNHGITLNQPDQSELGSEIGRFIDDYVFPGGELAHVSEVIKQMARQGLEPWDVESLRPHYVHTLWRWSERLEARRAEAIATVGEKRFRIWRIYLAGSAHAFDRGWMSIFQILAGKRLGTGQLALPLTREHVYCG